MDRSKDIFSFSDSEVVCWIATDSSIMLKAVTKKYMDPVELTAREARNIADKLIEMTNKLDEERLAK